jgi:hypothetical protein
VTFSLSQIRAIVLGESLQNEQRHFQIMEEKYHPRASTLAAPFESPPNFPDSASPLNQIASSRVVGL